MAATKFSDYLGLNHYKKAKKLKHFIHLALAYRPQSLSTYHSISPTVNSTNTKSDKSCFNTPLGRSLIKTIHINLTNNFSGPKVRLKYFKQLFSQLFFEERLAYYYIEYACQKFGIDFEDVILVRYFFTT